MDKVYIETSIVSHAAARPSQDVTVAGLQQQARDWWANERHKFEPPQQNLWVTSGSGRRPIA